jgi:hypothetical protein
LMEDHGLGYHEAHERASAAERSFRRRGARAARAVSGR